MRFGFVTLFPATIRAHMEDSVIGRAVARDLVSWRAVDPRDFTYDVHRKVDDVPYGGEPGMLIKAEPVARALGELVRSDTGASILGRDDLPSGTAVVVTEPGGRRFDQDVARELARFDHIVFVCGHYEGIDHRFEEAFATHVLSIGDFVLTGGELPALTMADAVARLVTGVLGSASSLAADSFDQLGRVSAPNYTRPPVWNGLKVPEVLLSGDHGRVRAWREQESSDRSAARAANEPGARDAAELIAYDRWANDRLRPVAELLGEIAEERMSHIGFAHRALLKRCGVKTSKGTDVYAEWAALLGRKQLDEEILWTDSNGVARRHRLGSIVNHVLVHGAFHRGEIRRLAEQTGVEFPETDVLVFEATRVDVASA